MTHICKLYTCTFTTIKPAHAQLQVCMRTCSSMSANMHMLNKFKNHATPHFNKENAGHFTGLWFAFNVGFMRKMGGFYISGDQTLVDNVFHQTIINAGKEFYILDAVYVYHWYRADNEYPDYMSTRKTMQKAFYDNFKITQNVKYTMKDEKSADVSLELL